jgi:predicted SprT family Zn-dependent metalloprotease
MLSRGFPNIDLVNNSIGELYRRLSRKGIELFPRDLSLNGRAVDLASDPVIRAQHIAYQLAYHFRLAVSSVVVTFRSNLPVPGRIELSSSLDFFIELHATHRDDPKAIAAILAHEVAHIFLHQTGIRLEPEFHNEVLTDTTAVYLGCGAAILNGASETVTRYGNTTERRYRQFGYLTVDEFGYIHSKRDRLHHRDSSASFDSGFPKAAFRADRKRLAAEAHVRPYARKVSGFMTNLFWKIPGGSISDGKMTFACGCCSKALRIPVLGKRLTVRCPRCESSLQCFT